MRVGELVNMVDVSIGGGRNKAFSESRSSVTALVQNFAQDNRYCNSAEVVIWT